MVFIYVAKQNGQYVTLYLLVSGFILMTQQGYTTLQPQRAVRK